MRQIISDMHVPALPRSGIFHRQEIGSPRQVAKQSIERQFSGFLVDGAHNADMELIKGEDPCVQPLEVIGHDVAKRIGGSPVAPGIGMIAIEFFCLFVRRQSLRITFPRLDIGYDPGTDSLNRAGVETRLVNRQFDQ